MALSTPFSELTRIVEGLERSGVDLHRVGTDGDELVVDGTLSVTVEFGLPLCDAVETGWATLEVGDAAVDAAGRLSADLSIAASLLPADVAAWTTDVKTGISDGELLVSMPVEIPGDASGMGGLTPPIGSGLRTPDGEAGTGDPAVADPEGGPVDAATNGTPLDGALLGATADLPTDESSVDEPTAEPDSDERGVGSAADRPRVPPFRDHELLREVYDSCDTFAEMTKAIGMDVTDETVRRYMIDAGIHEPASYNTGEADDRETDENDVGDGPESRTDDRETDEDDVEDGTGQRTDGTGGRSDGTGARSGDPTDPADGTDASTPGDAEPVDASHPVSEEVIYADGVGLPDGVTVEGLIDAITISNTLYEVSHALDLERGRARNVLADLNLLDLVVGRLAMEAEREVTRDEVIDRIRAAADGRG